jgi:hypothetical protein
LNCPAEEWGVFAAAVQKLVQEHGLSVEADSRVGLTADGLPDVMLKTTPDRALALGRRVCDQFGMGVVVIAGCGVVHGKFSDQEATGPADQIRARVQACVNSEEAELFAVGGDWQSRHVLRPAAVGEEARWLELLERGMRQ